MTREILIGDKQFNAYHWQECPLPPPGETVPRTHVRSQDLLEQGVSELSPGEVSFTCDLTLVFDTTFALKGDNRKFVIISSKGHQHVAKPY